MMRCERIMVGAIGVLTVASIGIGCRAYMLKPEPYDVSADRMTTMPEEVWKPEYDIPATEYAYITDEQLAEIEAQEAQSIEDALLASATRIDNVTSRITASARSVAANRLTILLMASRRQVDTPRHMFRLLLTRL